MAEDSIKRKLRAILCADVKCYSRLMGEDEVGTFHTLLSYVETISEIIAARRGYIFSSLSDVIQALFTSGVAAMECAVIIRKKIQTKNADVAENQKMQSRIGVNIDDVIEKREQIYGPGVNIASRTKRIAETG